VNRVTTTLGAFPPLQNTPFVDDWVYAWSVEHLLRTGRLEVLDLSSNMNLAQVAWGSLFCLPFGFSFVALRVSTIVLAVAGLCGLYLLLRELQVARTQAVVGSAVLAIYPVFSILSVTFMTDVPFVSFAVLASAAFVRALRRRQVRWLAVAGLFAGLATAVRHPGVVISIAMLLTLLCAPDRWGRGRGRWVIAAIPLLFVVPLIAWTLSHTNHVADLTWIKNTPGFRLTMLREYALPFLPTMLGATYALICGTVGLAILPIAIACARRHLFKPVLVCFVCLAIPLVAIEALGVDYGLPLQTGQTWAANELGGTSPLVPEHKGPRVPVVIGWVALGLGTFSLAAAATACWVSGRNHRTFASAFCEMRANPSVAFLVLMILGFAVLGAVLWLIGDRYALIFVPLFIALVLAAKPSLSVRAAGLAIACYALFTAAGVRDHLQYNSALWSAVETLRPSVPDSEINGGYVVNGWLQYAHPQQAHHDADGNVDVPWVNGVYDPPYAIANGIIDGWEVLQTIGYNRWLGPAGKIYVLRRNGKG
jgi:hypothetical protein